MTAESADSPPRPVGAGVGEDDLDVLRYWPDLCVWRLLASEAPEPEPPLMLRERGEGDLRGPGGGPDRLGVTHGDAGLGLKILTPHGLLTCIGLDFQKPARQIQIPRHQCSFASWSIGRAHGDAAVPSVFESPEAGVKFQTVPLPVRRLRPDRHRGLVCARGHGHRLPDHPR